MTAYELAEKAEGLAYEIPADWSSGEPKNLATDIADMLRQQADRIAELEKQGEPVAWMLKDERWNDFCRYSSYQIEGAIALYTNPVKELTKELDALLCSVLGEAYLGEEKEQALAKEIRAILRKAQEK